VTTDHLEGNEKVLNDLLERWKDPEEVSKDDKGAKATEEDENSQETEDEVEEDTEEQDQEDTTNKEDVPEKPKATKVAEDDAEITFTENGVEHKITVKEAKRLAGQEAALTRKSQETAAERKAVDDLRTKHTVALTTLLQRAEDAYKPYAGIDMLVAQKELTTEEFAALRSEQLRTYKDYLYVKDELESVVASLAETQAQEKAQQAQECIKTLTDPEKGIEGWNQVLYTEIMDYAVNNGLSRDVVLNIVDPAVIKLLHKAMSADKVKTVATTKKATAPKKVVASTVSSQPGSAGEKSALARLRTSGSRDDAVAAMLERWKDG
jgi:hypothetical protein